MDSLHHTSDADNIRRAVRSLQLHNEISSFTNTEEDLLQRRISYLFAETCNNDDVERAHSVWIINELAEHKVIPANTARAVVEAMFRTIYDFNEETKANAFNALKNLA